MSQYESSDEEYEVESIVDHRGNGRSRKYLVKWVGYGDEANTWEPLANLEASKDLIEEYHGTSSKKTKKSTKQSDDALSSDDNQETDTSSGDDDDIDETLPSSGSNKRVLRSRKEDLLEDEDWGQQGKSKRLRTTEKKSFVVDNFDESGSDDDDDEAEADDDNDKVFKYYELVVDGIEQPYTVIDDNDYPATKVNWKKTIKKIVIVFREEDTDKKRALIQWEDGEYSLHDVELLHRKCPLLLLDFYENHLAFGGGVKVAKE